MVNWTDSAKADLNKIHDYIADDSTFYAKKMVNEIVKEAEVLSKFPTMGRMVPEIMDDSIRELILSPYRIIYATLESNTKVI